MKRPFVTVILAGGKGTRMGTNERHKVCFEVLGVPVIIRALETYNLCGSALNVIVVGMMAETVMATVNQRFPGTSYAFQDKQRGTGDAARKGAEILDRMGFEGDILVVAGDKVIDPKVIRQLLATHEQTGADVTLATAKRPPGSSAGILLKAPKGNIVGILEEAERRRVVAIMTLNEAFREHEELTRSAMEDIVGRICGEKTARSLGVEIWPKPASATPSAPSPDAEQVLARREFQARFSKEERLGCLKVAGEMISATQILERFDQMNMSTYLFRAPVLFDALSQLKSSRANQEEYLTDVFEILSRRKKPAKIVGCEVEDPNDLMAFNNPQELLAVQEVYHRRQGQVETAPPAPYADTLAPASRWDELLANPSPAARKQFRQWYGEDVPWQKLRDAVGAFARRYGSERPIAIVRSPGRINLMGRHIDHQGGTVNVMAVNREIIVVAAPRKDDVVSLTNTQGTQFMEEGFRISDLVANLNWEDWQRVIDGPRLQRLLEAARGDWANYVKAAILRLQEQFRDRQLRGLDMMVSGDIPMGSGLSSSSALVVATAEVVRLFNRLAVSAQRLVSLCGEGEWFVGTRGGAADHAAIKLSHRGCVTRVGFFPFRIEDSARFFPEHDLVACNSGIYAGKSRGARNTFNAKVTAYHIGRIWFKMLRPDLAPRIAHLRDITPENLGLSRGELAQLLSQLPVRIARGKVQAALAQIAEPERAQLERMFQSHEAPADGYAVQGVVLFGLSEMSRARQCLDLLKQGDAASLGKLMTTSHDGDRVSRAGSRNVWRRLPRNGPAPALADWGKKNGRGDLSQFPGSYGCSLPEIDRIVDLASRMPGVEGAQLAGAGLGGCVMALVRREQTGEVRAALAGHGIQAEVFRPIAGAGSLTMA